MNADRFLELYEQISEAPDAIARMRRFVLDLAVRGKLTAPDLHGHTARSLVDALQMAKVRAGNKAVFSVVKPEEIPFELPEHWTWSRVGEICLQTGSGSTPRGGKSAYVDEGILFLRSQNVYDEGLRLSDVAFIPIETHQKMARTAVRANDILLNITGGSIGRCALVPSNFDTANVSQHVSIVRCGLAGFQNYLHLVIRSPYFQKFIFDEQNGAGREGLPKKKMDLIPIPLPPDQTQYDIVAKVDELMALCDRLEEARKTREETRDKLTVATLARLTAPEATAASEIDAADAAPNQAKPENAVTGSLSGTATAQPSDFPTHARFAIETLPALTSRPDQIKSLRQTILNLAVRGKLVEQDPADEPASVQLTRIEVAKAEQNTRKNGRSRGLPRTEEETTTNLPIGWSKVRLTDVAISMRYGTSVKCGQDQSQTPVLRIPNVSGGRISLDDMKYGPLKEKEQLDLALNEGDLLMIRSNGSLPIVGRSAVVTKEASGMSFAGYLVRLRSLPAELSTSYIWMALNSQLVRDQIEQPIRSAVGLKNVNLTEFGNLSFWLPPLAEQHRIVAKVDALMTLCDRLEAALTTADTTRSRLLEALLHEALEPAGQALEAAE